MRQGKPLIYQEVDGSKRAVSGGFTTNGNRAGFTVGDYDKTRPLVIDPAIINYSTYLAGEDNDRVHDIVADGDGNAGLGWRVQVYKRGNNNVVARVVAIATDDAGQASVSGGVSTQRSKLQARAGLSIRSAGESASSRVAGADLCAEPVARAGGACARPPSATQKSATQKSAPWSARRSRARRGVERVMRID